METMKRKWKNLPIRRFFILTVAFTLCAVLCLSALVIWCCVAFRRYLLPDSNSVYLTIEETLDDGTSLVSSHLIELDQELQSLPFIVTQEASSMVQENDNEPLRGNVLESRYSIQKIENTFDTLTPKRKLAYQLCGIAMIGVPLLLSFSGILLCSIYFYRLKIAPPLRLLTDATKQIARQNLDFTLDYACQDEMGQLCSSFTQMQKALHENNKTMWKLLEERKLMQASIAHDLRNPIAIIEGYTEYLQLNLSGGRLSMERIGQIAKNLNMAAKRLEIYTESILTLNYMEELELETKTISAAEMAEDIIEDLKIIANKSNICLCPRNDLPDRNIRIDISLLYRILENLFGNALRFARHTIFLGFTLENETLTVTVSDDGCGFSEEILNQREGELLPKSQEDGHMQMGLKISRLLCEKHGGTLSISNTDPCGALVRITLSV